MKINSENHKRGINHANAKHAFKDVELARTLYEQDAKPVEIADYIDVSINTLWDWLTFKTRVSS